MGSSSRQLDRKEGSVITRWKGLTAVALVAAACASATTAAAPTREDARACNFQLRIGTVLPFTGDLSAFGGNMDRAVRLAVDLQNQALRNLGLSGQMSSVVVASEDGQTKASASVEAATKLVKTDRVNVIIGEMASSATIPMAQSVTIPNRIVTISPTSSAPQITQMKDRGYLYRVYPSDHLQGRVLAQAAIDAFGRAAEVNVGSRNDAFGNALRKLFVQEYARRGGRVGVNMAWNPNQANFDSDAQKLVEGEPAGWVIIDFADTFLKMAPSLFRTGTWSASKTIMTEALRVADQLKKIEQAAKGLRGTAATSVGAPARAAFDRLWKERITGGDAYTGFEGTAFDAANLAFLAAVRACSSRPSAIKSRLRLVSGPPGRKLTYRQMNTAIKLSMAGKDINYEGAWGPIDFDVKGDPGSAVYEIWQYTGGENIRTVKTITFRGR
jgi:ABC-type branched-subunit amino acid transport system substrate-binding protein